MGGFLPSGMKGDLKMNKTVRKYLIIACVLATIFATLGASKSIKANKISTNDFISQALISYQKLMSGENIEDKAQMSDTILQLVNERQSFYQKYFSEGLNSDLVNIESEFDQTTMKTTSTGEIEVIEIVNLTGISKLQNAADYPPYQAALLALKLVEEEDQELTRKLETYATDILLGVQQSIDEGEYTFSIVNKHTISVDYEKGIILEDYYSSESMDDLGTDKVVMFDGKPERIEPDFSLMPDHMMYVTPIEELANILLKNISGTSDDYSASSGVYFISTNTAPRLYSGSSAAAYIRTYVRNTSLTPNCTGVLENQINWNSSYNAYDCNDCANYVSQA